MSFLHPSLLLFPPNHFFPLNSSQSLKHKPKEKLQQESSLPAAPACGTGTGARGTGDTVTPRLRLGVPCFPAGNAVPSRVEAPRERSLTVHTPAGPQPRTGQGKAREKCFPTSFLHSRCDGELERIKQVVPRGVRAQSTPRLTPGSALSPAFCPTRRERREHPCKGKETGRRTSCTGKQAWEP